jgi:polyribonucleotide nucleotidyltransferase
MGVAEGILHISELANHRVRDVRDVLKEGEQISVKVIKIAEGGTIHLSCIGLGQP